MSLIISILGKAALAFLLVNAKPAVILRERVYKSLYGCEDYRDKWHYQLITCSLCLGFWVGFLLTFNIYIASIVSVIAELICQKINSGRLW